MLTPETRIKNQEKAIRYLRAIRNPFKRAYGFDCYNAAIYALPHPPRTPELSVLAAQAVRLSLTSILKGEDKC
jgi:hypothetical protein